MHAHRARSLPTWTTLVLSIAAAGIVASLAAIAIAVAAGGDWRAGDLVVLVPHMLVYSAAASLLILGHRGDLRAVYLGGFFLLVAHSFSPGGLRFYGDEPLTSLGGVGTLFLALAPEAFLPAFLWMFVRSFPRTISFGTSETLSRWAIRLSLAAGTILFAVNLVPLLGDWGTVSLTDNRLIAALQHGPGGLFWPLVFGLLLPALPFAARRARRARPGERRRVGLFLAGLVVGFGPIVIEVLLEAALPAYYRFSHQPVPRMALSLILYPLLLSIPVTTTYAVLVENALDVRLVVRKAVQYSLARSTVMAASIGPLAGLFFYSYQRRSEPLSAILSGTVPALLMAAGVVGVVMMRLRTPILARIDRSFFREQYNSRRILARLAEETRSAPSAREMGLLFSTEVDRALHVDSIGAFVATSSGDFLESPAGGFRPLSVNSTLAHLAAGSTRPLELDPEQRRGVLATLSTDDWGWLAEGAFVLLVPMIASDGRLLGLICLGEKKSEEPFSREDLLFLGAVAASGALALENRLLRDSSSRPGPAADNGTLTPDSGEPGAGDHPAAECVACGSIQPHGTATCPRCDGDTSEAIVPAVLFGKFRFERRIGSGGMGVVYLATDLTLDRAVAIKTLPSSSPGQSIRIRREARAMAAVSHPNLAMIHGAETWRGTPMLIMEYLSGGTLSRKLRSGPLDVPSTIDLGIAMCDVLDRIHGAGILHRDVKPSNIGIAADGQPKLLDFGVASVLAAARPGAALDGIHPLDASSHETLPPIADDDVGEADEPIGGFAGTPIYLSPEAVNGAAADPAQDLWALSLVLYEALSGTNPMMGNDLGETINHIVADDPPQLIDIRPDCPPALSNLLAAALSKDRAQRPASAIKLRQQLESL